MGYATTDIYTRRAVYDWDYLEILDITNLRLKLNFYDEPWHGKARKVYKGKARTGRFGRQISYYSDYDAGYYVDTSKLTYVDWDNYDWKHAPKKHRTKVGFARHGYNDGYYASRRDRAKTLAYAEARKLKYEV